MTENIEVTIRLDDLMKMKGDLALNKAMLELINVELKSAKNALKEKDGVIERLGCEISATEDAANNDIDYLQWKNRKLKKKLKKSKEYAEHMEGVVMFGQEFEGIKCTFEPENAADVILRGDSSDFPEFSFSCDDGDHSFWLGANG